MRGGLPDWLRGEIEAKRQDNLFRVCKWQHPPCSVVEEEKKNAGSGGSCWAESKTRPLVMGARDIRASLNAATADDRLVSIRLVPLD